MTLLVEKGIFSKSTTTPGPTSQTVTLSNGSLTPKLLILFAQGGNTINTYGEDGRINYGFSDGTNDACQSYVVSQSGEAERYSFRSDSILCIVNLSASTVGAQADVTSFAAGQFTLNWSINDANAQQIHYLVAGGTDITNVSVVSTTVGATSTGNKSYTGSGTTFTPDFALCMTGADGYATINTLVSSADQALFCLSAAKSTSKRWVMWGRDETVATSDCDMYLNPSACLSSCSITDGTITFLADFVSFDNAAGGGITVNVTDGADLSTKKLAFLFVKGGEWDCGAFQQRSGTGTQDITLTTGLDPALVFLGGIDTASSATVTANFYLGIGASDGTSEGCTWTGNTNGLGTYVAARIDRNDKIYRMAVPAATATSSTTSAEADMNDMTTLSKFQLNWTTADTTLRQMAFWALGTLTAANNVERALATETTSISEAAFTRLAAKTRTRTDTAITIGESNARLSTKLRPIATQITALSESIIRVKGKVKTLATETITIGGGTIARLLAKIRTASDTTVIAENRARLAAKTRALATQTTTLGDSVVRIKGKLKSLAAETITVGGGTAARLSSKIRAISLQTVSLTDNRTRLKASMRTLATQSITITGGTLARLKASLRTISQTTVLSENINRLSVKLRVLATQTVILADSVTRTIIGGAVEITRTLSQTVVLSETVSRRLAAQRILIQTSPIAENLARVRGVLKTLSQSIPISESRSRIKSALRPISQTVVSSDSITRLNTIRRTISQTVVTAENVAAETVGNLVRSMVETITVSDSITRRTAKLVILDQFVVIAEQASRISTKLRTIPSQTIILSDSATNELNVIIKNVLKTISQVTAISDYAKIEVVKKSQRFRKILQPSIKRLISNHPAWFLGTRGQHDHYEEFSP